jgi:16S rRNA A1518/A1519 N6-dimethyltransferase RsmA/KsgA/DIM1 with predicted DNA glycosylase/AP lyase activity
MGSILPRILSPRSPSDIERQLEAAGIGKTARPEDLTVEDWCALARAAAGAGMSADPAGRP